MTRAQYIDTIVAAYLGAPEDSPQERWLHRTLLRETGGDEAAARAVSDYIDTHGPVTVDP